MCYKSRRVATPFGTVSTYHMKAHRRGSDAHRYFGMSFLRLRSLASRCARAFALLAAFGFASEATLVHAREPGMDGDRPHGMMGRQRGEQVMQRQEERRAQREQQYEARQMNDERRQLLRRDERMQGAAGAIPPAPPQDGRGFRPERLSPDERRALRQQINDAGRNVYRAPPP